MVMIVLKTACRARGHGHRGGAALELAHPGLEDIVGGVAHAGIDVARFLEGEEPRRVLGALEDEGTRAVNGNAARLGRRVGAVTGLDGLLARLWA